MDNVPSGSDAAVARTADGRAERLLEVAEGQRIELPSGRYPPTEAEKQQQIDPRPLDASELREHDVGV